MSISPPITDNLWHCLCPAADKFVFRQLSQASTSRSLNSLNLVATTGQKWKLSLHSGRYHLGSRSYAKKAARDDELELGLSLDNYPAQANSTSKGEPSFLTDFARQSNKPPTLPEVKTNGVTRVTKATSTQELYDKLRGHSIRGETEKVYKHVSHLIRYAREKPNKRLYQALIRVNVSHDTGSAGKVVSLLKEMDVAGIPLDIEICQDVLAVLAIHPNYLLRIEILAFLREHWHSLTASDEHYVIASILRDNQFELALDWIDKRIRDGQKVLPWIMAKAVHMLCQAHEVDEALRIARLWEAKTSGRVSPFAWYHILDVASRNFNHMVVVYIWRTQVTTGYLNPPSGVCLNVLATSARYGDPDLATEVFEVLGKRSTIFHLEHYELLLDAYVRAKDLKTAMKVLVAMHKSGRGAEEESMRNLYDFFREKPSRILRAREILIDMHEEGEDVPLVALNCLIRALIEIGDLSTGISVYKTIHELCSSKPNAETFNILLRGCLDPVRMDLAMFLAAEMKALKVCPNQLTYDRLVLICTSAGALNDACRYYTELCTEGFKLRDGTLRWLLSRLGITRDARVWDIVRNLNGRQGSEMRAIAEKAWRQASTDYISITGDSSNVDLAAENAIEQSTNTL